jgi:hypothetical protein
MFKKAFIILTLLILLLLASTAFSARLVDPISKEIVFGDFTGSIVPGSTLELIISKELGKFDSLEVTSALPEYFDVRVEDYLEAIKIFVSASKETPLESYDLDFILKGEYDEERVNIYFVVEEELLDVALNNYSATTIVNSDAIFEFSLINNSHGNIEFFIKPSLPWYWLSEINSPVEYYKKVVVPKKSIVKETLIISPRVSGERAFNTTITFGNNQKEFSLLADTKPTFGGKFSTVFNGFPFYSFSLTPSYYLTGVLTLFFG